MLQQFPRLVFLGLASLAILLGVYLSSAPHNEGLLRWPPQNVPDAQLLMDSVRSDTSLLADRSFFIWRTHRPMDRDEAIETVLRSQWGMGLTADQRGWWKSYVQHNSWAYQPPFLMVPLKAFRKYDPSREAVDSAICQAARLQ
jgi:hypothetical protein